MIILLRPSSQVAFCNKKFYDDNDYCNDLTKYWKNINRKSRKFSNFASKRRNIGLKTKNPNSAKKKPGTKHLPLIAVFPGGPDETGKNCGSQVSH